MPELPFEIPKSLSSYIRQFDNDPMNATIRLKKQLKKRGPDAIGHFLLAWFYHLKGLDEQAVEEALKAKTLAPGSPFFEKLHYYLSHPRTFDAWQPAEQIIKKSRLPVHHTTGSPVLEDLDNLIQKLSEVETVRITVKSDSDTDNRPEKKWSDDSDTDDIVSETLAKIHENQGKTEAAINTYERLKKLNREKKDYYKEQISRLTKLHEEREGDEEE